MDMFTIRIRGRCLGRSLEQELTLEGLSMAFERGCPEIHHSDQGARHTYIIKTNIMNDYYVNIIMDGVGEPEENGYAGRLMRTIKQEQVDRSEYEDFSDASRGLGRFLDEVDNRKRIHSSPGYLTPAEFEQQWIITQRLWRSVDTPVQ
jgi:putative transposase